MGGPGSTRWRDYEGRWHEGFPPPGWYEAPNGHWYPAPPQPPQQATPTAGTDRVAPPAAGSGPDSPAARVVAAYGRWPLWAQISAPIVAAVLFLGFVGSLVESPETVETSDRSDRVEAPATTTTVAPTTTTTVVTTTTMPPTVPPTTAAPPPAPPVVVEEPPPVEEPGGSCHPSYSGCLPFVSDVDCSGGSGDGPEYVVGPIEVYGSDPYDLDRDGDGVGCE